MLQILCLILLILLIPWVFRQVGSPAVHSAGALCGR
jgi:hypothetical protein